MSILALPSPDEAGHAPAVPPVRGPGQPFVLGHRPSLDGLRGLAVLAVVGAHLRTEVVRGGFIGVDVFFVLSGFLITALLLQEHRANGSINLRAFYTRRVLRLLPALVVVFLVTWLAALALAPRECAAGILHDGPSVFFYYFNWKLAFDPAYRHPTIQHLWSLSVEEQFYLVWPPLLAALLALRVRRGWLVALVLLGLIVPAAVRFLGYVGPSSVWRLYVATDSHADGLFGGCLVALLMFSGFRAKTPALQLALKIAAWVAFFILCGHCFGDPIGIGQPDRQGRYMFRQGGFTVITVCSVALLGALVAAPPTLFARFLEQGWLCWLGRVSYGLYLWHAPIFYYVLTGPGAPLPWLRFPLACGVSLAATAASYYGFERPILGLKHRLGGDSAARGGPSPPRAAARAA